MPVGAVTIDDKQVMAALTALQRKTDNMRAAYGAIGGRLKSLIQLGFRGGADPYGEKWAAVKDRAGTPLRDKGNLENAWTYAESENQVELSNNRTVTYKGDSHSLAAIHHFGAVIRPRPDGPGYLRWIDRQGGQHTAQKVTLPPRPQIPNAERGWPADWLDDVLDMIERFMTRANG